MICSGSGKVPKITDLSPTQAGHARCPDCGSANVPITYAEVRTDAMGRTELVKEPHVGLHAHMADGRIVC